MTNRGAFKDVPDEELRHLYIDQNLSLEEIAEIYSTTVGATASYLSKCGIKKGRELAQKCEERRNMEKLGVKSTLQLSEVKKKVTKTLEEKFGTDNVLKLKEFRDKAKATSLERYGVENAMMLKETQEKAKQTMFERYGAEVPNQVEEFNQKRLATLRERYGVDNPMKEADAKEKNRRAREAKRREKTGLGALSEISDEEMRRLYIDENLSIKQLAEKFGRAEYTMLAEVQRRGIRKSRELTEKHRAKTSEEKYGAPYPTSTEEVKEKTRKTTRERYGVDCSLSSPVVREKAKRTTIEKYGADNVNKITEFIIKRVKTRCGDEYPVELMNKPEEMKKFLDGLEKPLSIPEIAESIGVAYSTLQQTIKRFNLKDHENLIFMPSYSKEEKEICKWLEENGIEFQENVYGLIPGYELDIFIPEKKIAIEFDGDFWHCELRKPKYYHQRKSKLGKEAGIFVYHIFEYEWRDKNKRQKILSHLSSVLGINQKVVYARNCELGNPTKEEKKQFLENNHLQGNDNSLYYYGLYHNGELVSLMTFGKPRFSKNYEWEIFRFCSKNNYSVIGGAGKLFKHFLDSHEGGVISYSDFAKMSGKLYEKLGFKDFGVSQPSYVWFKGRGVLTRYQTQMKNEVEIMHERGYKRIYDCGVNIWVYPRENK